ncbi:MAG TPA: glycosyltransferase [Steroidobacteraceae bacterium]|nr:glycosyltransferase [Steroidobacteraceae bacterium]
MPASESTLRCLWIARYIPHPMDAGAKVYSARLAESVAATGASVRFLGFGRVSAVPPQSRIEWVAVPGEKRGRAPAFFSTLPVAAATDATSAFATELDRQLREPWDAIVFDGYGTGWALERCLAHRNRHASAPPVLVHVSHNHEETLWRSMARESSESMPMRIVHWQNYIKVRALERRIVRNVDLLTTITDEDAREFRRTTAREASLTLTPGHAGVRTPSRVIDARVPRRVILVGSFRWVLKQENLRRFIALADPVFAKHDIELDVVGDVAGNLLNDLQESTRATRFCGFIDDLTPYFAQARMAVVPELIGGGFKLKFLDYIFARVPVATLSQAAAGFPAAIREATLARDDFESLIEAIVSHIDYFRELNRMHERAYSAAESQFDWQDRGLWLQQAMASTRRARPGR